MKILVSWLRDFVDVPGTAEEIARTMSTRGFAVESVDPCGTGDAVIDFEVTANRPDCLSEIGIAREVAIAYGLPPPRDPPRALPAAVERSDIDVVIESATLCPRYVGAVADVTMGPSPAWMQSRLHAAGVRPISNIVDITNYVMLELGQPMHAFDLARIGGGQIRVRTARAGETLRTLDGQVRDLTPDMLLIADAARPIAIGGVMGGAESEVSAATTAIVLEAAYFNPRSVRRTSRTLGLKTEASTRFERGADPDLPAIATARACALIELTGAGRARGTMIDRYPTRIGPSSLGLRRHKIAGLLGAEIPDADVQRILEGLGFTVRGTQDGWEVAVPPRRADVAREVDLVEEVARHYGFDRLPTTFPPLMASAPLIDPRVQSARQARTVLTGAGFSEAVTFGFISAHAAAPFAAGEDIVAVANPLSESFGVLRPSALPGLLDGLARNRNRQQRDVRLFEVGSRFSKSNGEGRVVACAWTGAAASDHWSGGGRDVDFFDMKGIAERVCHALRIDATRAAPHRESWLVPGRAAVIMADGLSGAESGGLRLGVMGQLAPAVADAHGLPAADPVYVAEIDLDAVEAIANRVDVRVEPLPRFPSVTRDVSILVDDALAAETLRDTIRRAAPATLVRVREFDRYQGQGVPNGKVSLSLRLTFQSPERTLTDAEVQAAMDGIIGALITTHAAVQR
ncbi:MAG: phenylalanine--tRNA ligase subunit beta [Vicinamibacterales bacterium]